MDHQQNLHKDKDSKKYKDLAKNTKASFCITNETLKNELPKNCTPLIVNNVLVVEVDNRGLLINKDFYSKFQINLVMNIIYI